MSYEHCDLHDCDATNGCPLCAALPEIAQGQLPIEGLPPVDIEAELAGLVSEYKADHAKLTHAVERIAELARDGHGLADRERFERIDRLTALLLIWLATGAWPSGDDDSVPPAP